MDAQTKRETGKFTYANGEYNAELEVEATHNGLELDLGCLIPWEWILAAREAVATGAARTSDRAVKAE